MAKDEATELVVGRAGAAGHSRNTTVRDLGRVARGVQQAASSIPNGITGGSYHAAGNVLQVNTIARTFTYDAENGQVSAPIDTGAHVETSNVRVGSVLDLFDEVLLGSEQKSATVLQRCL